jgi:K+-H+ exchange-related protein
MADAIVVDHMDVFLVPVAEDRYELYCEEPDLVAAPPAEAPSGFMRRQAHRFREQLAEAERIRRAGDSPVDPDRSFSSRVKARTLRWIAESVAEQRLLWQLRRRATAQLIHPSDLTDVQARQLLQRKLQHDFERHRFWLVIDGIGLAGSAVLIVLPGPNVIGYYFLFRIAGHFLSVRGARHGMARVNWTTVSSEPLAALRGIVAVDPDAREERVRELASTLRLEHLASFFQRTAIP